MQLGVEKVELDELFRRADFITLHTPLTEKTKNIIDAAAIAKMKDGVRIINCARGGLVVEEDARGGAQVGQGRRRRRRRLRHRAGRGERRSSASPTSSARRISAPRPPRRRRTSRIQVAEQMADYLVNGAVSNALNMPSITAEEAPRLKPFITLAEKLGSFAGQLTETTDHRRHHRVCRRRRRDEHQGADRGAARRAAAADPGRGQHGQRAGGGARARHRGRRGAPDAARRLRDLYPPDGADRASRSARSPAPSSPTAARASSRSRASTWRPASPATCSTSPTATGPASSAASARCSATSKVNIANFNLGRVGAGRGRDLADRGRRADQRCGAGAGGALEGVVQAKRLSF